MDLIRNSTLWCCLCPWISWRLPLEIHELGNPLGEEVYEAVHTEVMTEAPSGTSATGSVSAASTNFFQGWPEICQSQTPVQGLLFVLSDISLACFRRTILWSDQLVKFIIKSFYSCGGRKKKKHDNLKEIQIYQKIDNHGYITCGAGSMKIR